MAKLIIEIDDDRFEKIKCGTENYFDYQIFLAKLHNATVLPTNATNGDVIKAMFPNAIIYDAGIVVNVEFSENEENWYDKDWWNAPYEVTK